MWHTPTTPELLQEDYAVSTRIAPSAALAAAIEELLAEGLGDGERLAEIGRLGARLTLQRAVEEEATYWAALDEATSPADGEPRLRRLVTDLDRAYPSAAACLAEDLPTLCVHLEYPLRLRWRLRSTNLLERSLEEVKRRTKAVLDLFIASARGLGLTALEH